MHPFLLRPDAPPGGLDLRAELAAKYGADKVLEMHGRVVDAGRRAGARFDWSKVTRMPSTVAGHAVVDAAPKDRVWPLLEALHVAYFEQGADIGAVDVLAAVAAQAGVAADVARAVATDPTRLADVRARARAATTTHGIRSVPTFVRAGGRALRGAQSQQALAAFLRA